MYYEVTQRWLSGKGNKVWKSGDIVTASDFPQNIDELVRQGRLKARPDIKDKEIDLADLTGDLETKLPETDESDDDILDENPMGDPLFTIKRKGEDHPVFVEDDINKSEIVAELEARKIPFDKKNKKAVLWALLNEKK